MASIASISTWRPHDGKAADFMAKVATAKKIHERLGGRVRVWQTYAGAAPMTVGYVIEHDDWKAFGEFGARVEADSEWQQFWTDALSTPTATMLTNSVVSEVPL